MADLPVLVDVDRDIATLTLNRPDRYNALSQELLDGLDARLTELADDDEVRVVVLTGAGKAFCSGGDLRAIHDEAGDHPGPVFHRLAGRFHESVLRLRRLDKPVVAAINGPAAGGGFSLALACDIRVIADDAFMMVGYVANGLSMDGGGSFALPRLVGLSRALEIALFDERMPAERAHELGLVHRVASRKEFDQVVASLVERLAEMPSSSIALTKRLFNQAFENSLVEHLDQERESIARAAESADGQEGIAAFLEKRKPDYRG